MGRENLVVLNGQVTVKMINKTGTLVMLGITVLRRPRNANGTFRSQLQFDVPVVLVRGDDAERIIRTIAKGDMVEVKGVLSTRQVMKSSYCSSENCQKPIEIPGVSTYVTPISIEKKEERLEIDQAHELIKQRVELSNICMLLGTLCRDIETFTDDKGRTYTQYQLAVSRRFRIASDPVNIKVDYPWVKVYGAQAEQDKKALHQGSEVFINGSLQSRKAKRKMICPHCGNEYTWTDDVTEVVPYATEYLNNYNAIVNEEDDSGTSFYDSFFDTTDKEAGEGESEYAGEEEK